MSPAKQDQPRMTLRISRDGGRTWEKRRTVQGRDPERLTDSGAFPACTCPRCMKAADR